MSELSVSRPGPRFREFARRILEAVLFGLEAASGLSVVVYVVSIFVTGSVNPLISVPGIAARTHDFVFQTSDLDCHWAEPIMPAEAVVFALYEPGNLSQQNLAHLAVGSFRGAGLPATVQKAEPGRAPVDTAEVRIHDERYAPFACHLADLVFASTGLKTNVVMIDPVPGHNGRMEIWVRS
jgi:hypothetical protein